MGTPNQKRQHSLPAVQRYKRKANSKTRAFAAQRERTAGPLFGRIHHRRESRRHNFRHRGGKIGLSHPPARLHIRHGDRRKKDLYLPSKWGNSRMVPPAVMAKMPPDLSGLAPFS